MSEYSRRIVAFSAIAIALGIGVSLGIVDLPTLSEVANTSTTSTTLSSTVASTQSVSSVISAVTSSTTSMPASSTTEVSTATGGTTIMSGTTTVVTSVESTTATVSSISSVTSNSNNTCGPACGGFSITAISLSVGNNSSTLDVTLQAEGNAYVGSATVYINNTVIGTPPASERQPPGNIMLNIQPNQSSTIVLVIPSSTIVVQPGLNYFVLVYGWIGTPSEPANTGVEQATDVTAN